MSFIDSILANLPTTNGLLPSWLLFISAVSVFNSAQTYIADTTLTRRVYARQPDQVTPLSARTFGTWTLMASMIRFFGAYYTSHPAVYNMTIWTFVLAGFHFGTEWLVFGTAKLGKGLAGPLTTVALTLPWMILQRDFYVHE